MHAFQHLLLLLKQLSVLLRIGGRVGRVLRAGCRQRARALSLQRGGAWMMRLLFLLLLFVFAFEKVFLEHARTCFLANKEPVVVDIRICCH
jgi:hypothetical protein